jgi:hypothetical protein
MAQTTRSRALRSGRRPAPIARTAARCPSLRLRRLAAKLSAQALVDLVAARTGFSISTSTLYDWEDERLALRVPLVARRAIAQVLGCDESDLTRVARLR